MGLSFSWSVLIPVTFGSVQLSSTSLNRNKALTRVLKIFYIWTHESVLAVVTAPPDLIKRWPEWSWRGHSCLIKAFLICWCLFDSTKIADRFCQCLLSHVSHSCVFFIFVLFSFWLCYSPVFHDYIFIYWPQICCNAERKSWTLVSLCVNFTSLNAQTDG